MKSKRPVVSAMTLEEQMWRAVINGHLNRCRILLNKGVNRNTEDYSGRTLLHVAAFHGRAMICRLLIDRGADILGGTERRSTPLESAAANGHVEACRMLVAAGARRFPARASVRQHGNGVVSVDSKDSDNYVYFRSVDEAKAIATGEAREYLQSPEAYEQNQRLEADTAPALAPSRRSGRL